jgi:hypothetical protein
MRFLSLLLNVFAWFCLAIGLVTLLGVLDPFHTALTWTVWFGLSALLFLSSISANTIGGRHGGEEY